MWKGHGAAHLPAVKAGKRAQVRAVVSRRASQTHGRSRRATTRLRRGPAIAERWCRSRATTQTLVSRQERGFDHRRLQTAPRAQPIPEESHMILNAETDRDADWPHESSYFPSEPGSHSTRRPSMLANGLRPARQEYLQAPSASARRMALSKRSASNGLSRATRQWPNLPTSSRLLSPRPH